MTVFFRLLIWRTIAVLFLLLAIIGIALPIMPTVPFLLVTAWAGGKGWPVLEQKLLAHPTYGPQIIVWREHRVVSRRTKVIAVAMMTGSSVMLVLSPVMLTIKLVVIGIMATVALWLCLRPEQAPATKPPAQEEKS
ncbi:YbaN family protein [Pseudidiomarina salinarum]|uniref:YbaN family protein n=1 Tax=Pseudidiomarina salinarum TaxID=435908 RepID=UPI00054ECED1|nr:YbaN family protein [Pseudidiomarina salinarum]RUO69239.1 DUF454 domain-containing protein [Pseudidiomarina salinarum]